MENPLLWGPGQATKKNLISPKLYQKNPNNYMDQT